MIYQIGGSLPECHATYVVRKADEVLFQALQQGTFCYVLNSRQMGKSSLLVRTMGQLQAEGVSCVSLDLSDLGSKSISQWYGGVAYKLLTSFGLFSPTEFISWWQSRDLISPVQRLAELIHTVVLPSLNNQIVIFIDEIDSVLSLPEPVDDFFAFIRGCYNKRADNIDYQRLTFTLLGVATPSDLIGDSTRTPFNIGKAINLTGFTLEEALPLLPGLEGKVTNPLSTLEQILWWTGGQPFLTQKLCHLVAENGRNLSVNEIVEAYIIYNWEGQDEPTHLRTIRDRLLRNEQQTGKLLGIYQKVLQENIQISDTQLETELKLSGLVTNRDGYLQVNNPIYAAIFNSTWLDTILASLRPYGESLTAWIASKGEDNSRLLRGKALEDARNWASDKNLSAQDYHFLFASQEEEIKQLYYEKQLLETVNQEKNQRELVEKQIIWERQKLYKISLSLGSSFIAIASFVFGIVWMNQMTLRMEDRLNNLSLLSEALLAENKQQEALESITIAAEKLQNAFAIDYYTRQKIIIVLHQGVAYFRENKPIIAHGGKIHSLSFSSDGQVLLTASDDNLVKLWNTEGKLLQTMTIDEDKLIGVQFNLDNEIITISASGVIQVWNFQGELLTKVNKSRQLISYSFSPDYQVLATVDGDGMVRLSGIKTGELIQSFYIKQGQVNSIGFSPRGGVLAIATDDSDIRLWNIKQPHLFNVISSEQEQIFRLIYSDDGKLLASASEEGSIKLWQNQDQLVAILPHPQLTCFDFSPDKKIIVSASSDGIVKFWYRDGRLVSSFHSQVQNISSIRFNGDGTMLSLGTADGKLLLWNLDLDYLLDEAESYQ